MSGGPPRATVVLMTYRHADFIEQAVASYLSQDCAPIEILICDDRSPDDTAARARAAVQRYRGPHAVRVVERAQNDGPLRNFLGAVDEAQGALIVEAHGDDIAAPDRVARLLELAARTGASLIASDAWVHAEDMDQSRLNGPQGGDQAVSLGELAGRSFDTRFLGATFCYDKRVFTQFPDLRQAVRGSFGAGDHFLPFRAGLLGGVWYLDAPLVHWRQHPGQVTRRVIQTGEEGDESWRQAGLETVHAFGMQGVLRRLSDLAHVESQGPRPDAGALRAATVRLLAKKAGRWSAARAGLRRAGHALEWRGARGEPS